MANERDTAVELVRQLLSKTTNFKDVRFFAILDNTCQDGTVDILRDYAREETRLEVVWCPDNTCVVDAYMAGYRVALAAGSDWILEIDAGFSHQPADLPAFLDRIAPDVDCIFGSRFCPGGRITETPARRRVISRGGTVLTNALVGTKLTDMTSGYQMFRRHALRHVLEKGIMSRSHFFQTEMKVHCRHMCVKEVPIHYRAASDSVNQSVLADSFRCLFRLVGRRLSGDL